MKEEELDVGLQALLWVIQTYPEASIYKRLAFVNSVTYLVTGKREGLGGPSLRERLVVRQAERNKHLKPGEWKFEEACRFAAEYCFAPCEDFSYLLGQILEEEFTYHDDPDDIKELKG